VGFSFGSAGATREGSLVKKSKKFFSFFLKAALGGASKKSSSSLGVGTCALGRPTVIHISFIKIS
jgi:hypothetical protein